MPSNEAQTTAAPEAIISVRTLNKFYGQFQVLHDIDLEVRPGERIVICGPSGSGKSSLIRCLNGLEDHSSGEVLIDGKKLDVHARDIKRLRAEVGMCFQQFNLFPHLTVLENCTLSPRWVRKQSRKDADAIAMHLLGKVHIAEHAHKYPSQLSGGQQQRVAIARALCMKPKAMLFDEPTSALDPEMISEVLETMMELAAEGMTMVCVTHEMGFARKVADRIVFMERGKILANEQPEQFFGRQTNSRIREFLGEMHG